MTDNAGKKSESSLQASVSSLQLATTNWTLAEQNSNENVFESAAGDVVGVEFRTEEMLFPLDFSDMPALRANIRMGFGGAGLLSADVVEIAVGASIKKGIAIITKLPQIPSGRSYNGLIFLAFKDFSYSLYMRYEEAGTMGLREAALADELLESGEITLDEETGRLRGFEDDLYDPLQRGPLVRNKAEREIYDERFPNHPLTRTRHCMGLVLNSLELAPELEAAEQPF